MLERQELEEFFARSRDVARVIKAQYDGFVEVGFDPPQALALTRSWMMATFGSVDD